MQSIKKLSVAEREIFDMFYKQKMSIRQISIIRKTRMQTVKTQLKIARKKKEAERGMQFHTPPHPTKGYGGIAPGLLRLHGEQFSVKIIHKDNRYANLVSVSNQITIDESTVKLWSDSIEVYANRAFFGRDASQCDAEAALYWSGFARKVEERLSIVIVSDTVPNWRRVAAHYERIDSEIGRAAVEQGRQIRIYAADGKLRFVTDRSLKGKNHEALHPVSARPDIDRVERSVDDWLNGQPTPGEAHGFIVRVAEGLRVTDKHVDEAVRMHSLLTDQVTAIAKQLNTLTSAIIVLTGAVKNETKKSDEENPSEDEPKQPSYFG